MNDRIVATIAAVYSDGVTLTFPTGETSTKHYKCNTNAGIAAGDRVILSKIGGTYVVDYKVGAPNSGGGSGGAVTSVNGKTGAVQLTASDVSARPNTWVPTAAQVGARPNTWTPSASDVGAVPTTRTVNEKALSSDITLAAADVGAVPFTMIYTELTNTDGLTNVAGTATVKYYCVGNVVTISFNCRPSTANTWLTIFVLPAAYRPPFVIEHTISNMKYIIRADGAVRLNTADISANVTGIITYAIGPQEG